MAPVDHLSILLRGTAPGGASGSTSTFRGVGTGRREIGGCSYIARMAAGNPRTVRTAVARGLSHRHGGLYGCPGMYRDHSCAVMGWPVQAQIHVAAASGSVVHSRTVRSWLPPARVRPDRKDV